MKGWSICRGRSGKSRSSRDRRRPQACAHCGLNASEPGMYGHRKLLKRVRRFDVLRPSRTVQNESRPGAGLAQKLTFPPFAGGKRPGSARPDEVATVTRSWHSLLENCAQSAWQPPATLKIFVAETWVVIQVEVASKQSITSIRLPVTDRGPESG